MRRSTALSSLKTANAGKNDTRARTVDKCSAGIGTIWCRPGGLVERADAVDRRCLGLMLAPGCCGCPA